MSTTYTIQLSNHPGAGARIPTAEAAESWKTIWDGPATAKQARAMVDRYARDFRNVRAFRGSAVGRMFYAVLSTQGD